MDYKSKTANDKEISIYYFSATGNSLKLSQDIAAAFGGAGAVQNDTVSWNHRIGLPNRRFYIPRIYGRTARHCPPVLGKLSVQERRVLFLHRHILHVQGLCGVRCGQNHVRQRRASGLWLQPAHRRELPEGIRGIFSKEDEDTGTGGALHFTNNRRLEKRQTEKAFPVLQVIGSVAQRAVQCFFQSLALELLLGKWLYGMWCLRTCMSREQYYAEKRSAPVGNRLRGLPCLRTLVSPECHSDREVQRAAAIPSSSCKKNDAVPCGMTGSYAAYPEIPVCFPFVGFHRNQPVLALFMPTGHRNDMDDLTHPCHHLEESAHVLEYPHASLFAGYREWSNSMYQPSLTGLYSVVSLYVLR